jgi:hypothetical protein
VASCRASRDRASTVVAEKVLGDLPVPSHLDDAVASLEIDLTDDEVAELEAPYTPPGDFQGVSDDGWLRRGRMLYLLGTGRPDRSRQEMRPHFLTLREGRTDPDLPDL